MVNVSKHLQKNFCSQALPVCINVNWKVRKNQLKMGICINAMAMARWQKRQWWCFVAYRNQGRIYYSEYILFLFFWQRIRIFICDIPHPAAAAGSGGGGGVWCLNLIMWLLLVHIIIILILHQHHLLPPPATAATAQYWLIHQVSLMGASCMWLECDVQQKWWLGITPLGCPV